MTALELSCPHPQKMTPEARKVWLATYCDDLAHLTDGQISYGCARYRRDPANRFFPAPGQLLAACKNQYEDKPRRYVALEEIPPPMEKRDAMALIDETRRRTGFTATPDGSPHVTAEDRRAAILARPPLPYVAMTPERKVELLGALDRRLDGLPTGRAK